MSVARLLLQSLLPEHGPWEPDGNGAIVLTVAPDVIVNLVEDETAEEVHFISAVGWLGGGATPAVELSAGMLGGGRFGVRVSQPDGLVVPHRTVARSRLDSVSFCAELAGHVNIARAIAAAWCRQGAGDVVPRDEPPHPSSVRPLRWLPCAVRAASGGTQVVALPAS